ncbi:MAG: citrate/2-methylcitrate synthase [Candidatus Methanofastidiosa archaeon]|nr:citrate/2-methylcitrate synthase [Candidatus Methanofastidiosa archaeon]
MNIRDLYSLVEENDNIKEDYYPRYNVKRGLRNADGSGVLVGLTNISAVFGFHKIDEDTVPIEGELYYRGISIKDIVKGFQADGRMGFDEAAFLVLFGKLPTKDELDLYRDTLTEHRALHPGFNENIILKYNCENIMNILGRSVLALYSFDHNPDDTSLPNLMDQSINLIAKFPTIVAYSYHALRYKFHNDSLVVHPPREDLTTVENFLYMLRKSGDFTKLEAETLDLALTLHIDHGGGNNSTFTTHVVSSSGTDTYSTIAAALGSLKGPLHGGANRSVTDMMDNFKHNVEHWDDEGEVFDYMKKLLTRQAFDKSGKIYGLGHAVYTKSDPRAVILKEKAEELAKDKGRYEEFKLYDNIERLMPDVFEDVKGKRMHISPNVDFYSGFVYDCLDIPRDVYTPLFAVSRIVGWCAHRIEEIRNGKKIIRPAYKNVAEFKQYVPIAERF